MFHPDFMFARRSIPRTREAIQRGRRRKQRQSERAKPTSAYHHRVGIYNPFPSSRSCGSSGWHRRTGGNCVSPGEHYTKSDDRIQERSSHTLILLSRQGTQAVVTCFRGARLGFSDCGCMMISRFVELVRQQRKNTPACGGWVKGSLVQWEG